MYNLKLFIGISKDWIQPVMPISLRSAGGRCRQKSLILLALKYVTDRIKNCSPSFPVLTL